MARIGKAQRALDRAHEHREAIERLLVKADHLRDWFRDWAESQLRRDRFYVYSDAEHAVLAKELDRMKPHTGFAGYSIGELIDAAVAFSSDCDLHDEEFLNGLRAERPSELPRWQLLRLVGICRRVAGVPLPFRKTWKPHKTTVRSYGAVRCSTRTACFCCLGHMPASPAA